jgi:hypothetical protein
VAAAESISAAAVPSAPSLDAEPLVILVDHPRLMFELFGFALLRATSASAGLAWRLMQLRPMAPIEIAGRVNQQDLTQHAEFQRDGQLFHQWEEILHASAKCLGVATAPLHVVAPKQLVAEMDKGQQAIHWDSYEGHLTANEKLSCIMYCSSGSHSTAMPRFQPQHLRPGRNPAAMRAAAYLLDPEWYHSVPVMPGDIMIFRQSIPHFGVRNRALSSRVALFSMLSTMTQ